MGKGIEDVRARLKDRQVKDGALGTEDVTVCLDLGLVAELEQLEQDLALLRNQQPDPRPTGKARLGGATGKAEPDAPDVAELKEQLAAKEQEVRDASLRLVFRSLGSTRYQEILNANPNADDDVESNAAFLNDLAGACLHEVWDGDSRVTGIDWDEVRDALSYGEWNETTIKVLALNRRRVDVPFSLRPSKPNRS